ncbi:asparagine synthase [Rhodanobacter glycinis]|uniref:asparagine synthase n=1 Tax=Rhodanobacter glycinis TaxID=582702 RepID=UPI00112E3298|nr:asparagine synthase [Rhodanobacter glycinis]TPG50560.1 asparagine synthase [Rhodanobacter glycinis]
MLNAISVLLHGGNQDGYRRAARSMGRQGFESASRFEWMGGVLDAWGNPSQRSVENFAVRTSSGVACCVGPLWYRGRFGNPALDLLLVELGGVGRIDEMELRGNFALFLRTHDHCLLMNDVLGLVRLYASPDVFFYSTSWLATCAYAGGVALDEVAAAEYVLLGASHSDRTVARGVTTLPVARAFDLIQRKPQARLPMGIWDEARIPLLLEAAVDEICSHLQTVCREITMAFPGRTRAALSGGFDSRLIVAGLLACGSRPELFVYGQSTSDDVAIARTVAESAGLPIKVIDKSQLNRPVSRPDIERLVNNALFFDGLPNDGIYDAGADEQTRLEQNAGGCIALNGGGGEIFRNFFHLPDRSMHAADIVRTFYRGFDPKIFRRPDGLASWYHHLVASIGASLGLESLAAGRTLRRAEVELVYPLFRCHHWMSVNNSVAIRHGYYATPLVDLNMVRLAWQLPIAQKNAGKLESHLVARLDPAIARQLSAYGFRFSDGPDWRAHFSEWAHCARPVFARPFINSARRRLRGLGVAPDMSAHCRSLLPGEWQLDPVLDLARLPDNFAFARALAVEVAWRKLVA